MNFTPYGGIDGDMSVEHTVDANNDGPSAGIQVAKFIKLCARLDRNIPSTLDLAVSTKPRMNAAEF